MTRDESSDIRVDPRVLRRTACELATGAGELARQLLAELRDDGGAALGTRTKSTLTDPVTVVDTAVENYLRVEIARRRPGDTVLGEEEGGEDPAPGVVRWIVDPVDGTVNLLYGIPFCAVSVAAELDGEVLAGSVHVLGTGETFSAARGEGARLDQDDGLSRELRVSSCTDPALALVATGFAYDPVLRSQQGRALAHLVPRVRDIRRCGSAAIDLCMVAAGRVDAYYERGLKVWDHAAGSLIAAEAGAVVRTSDVEAVATFASTPGVADALETILGSAGVQTPGVATSLSSRPSVRHRPGPGTASNPT